MDSTSLLSVVGGALFLSIILATSLCTYCWRYKQPTSIPQRSSDSSPAPFVIRHPQSTYVPHQDTHRIGSIPYPLANSLSSPSITVTKLPSCPPSETGSQASYVNQSGEEGSNNQVEDHDSEDELNRNYIIVLPESPGTQASSHSSEKTYINEEISGSEDDSNSDCHDYENLRNSSEPHNQTSRLSRGSVSSDDDRGSSDYVNTEPNLL
ncbi:linker for activation of T-cells family member 1 [Pimephales promelas]|uniref:linker for activation of T-cells family member 1 n=1 Tax=Pimephales promelas TaxID=90988 RepID=UPI00195597F0|nr:linker for activation of T-cells family member 1 [Pimephales promelas]XP_039543673.1 linker for activation of T-cells family member 1 [Pimephales promelas]KAG1967589.1 linker for activation of T cells [Pimephales promelas]